MDTGGMERAEGTGELGGLCGGLEGTGNPGVGEAGGARGDREIVGPGAIGESRGLWGTGTLWGAQGLGKRVTTGGPSRPRGAGNVQP